MKLESPNVMPSSLWMYHSDCKIATEGLWRHASIDSANCKTPELLIRLQLFIILLPGSWGWQAYLIFVNFGTPPQYLELSKVPKCVNSRQNRQSRTCKKVHRLGKGTPANISYGDNLLHLLLFMKDFFREIVNLQKQDHHNKWSGHS